MGFDWSLPLRGLREGLSGSRLGGDLGWVLAAVAGAVPRVVVAGVVGLGQVPGQLGRVGLGNTIRGGDLRSSVAAWGG